ncbi:MAG TPA: pitrilysin family protein [Chloroflexia bacterium]|nr:pitrilysin family protein [Chloroflexia bacterium]
MIAVTSGEQATVYSKITLANGLRVVSAQMPHTRSAAVQLYIGVGARHEAARVSGVSHFVEHMVFKGTESRPNPVQISETIEGVGGSMNAATDHEHTNYRALVPSRYFSTALEVLADMLLRARFDPADIEKERAVILEEISSTLDAPGEIVDLVSDEMIWGKHPLGQDVAGSTRSVKRITRDDLISHVSENYSPSNIVISVAGNVTHETAVREAERLWGGIEDNRAEGVGIVSPRVEEGPRVRVRRKRTEQSNLILALPALPYTHRDRHVQDVLDAMLGGGMSSRLFVELRENLGLAYSVGSFLKTYADVGAFGVHAAVDNEQVAPAVRAIIKELYRIRDERVPEVELRKVKEYIKGHTLLSLERSGYVSHWGGWQELMLGRIETIDEVVDHIEEVTSSEVQTLAGRLFNPEAMHLAVVGPFKDSTLLENLF